MSMPLIPFLTLLTERAATDLETAFLSLPEDKRRWSPGGSARSAADMIAECALVSAEDLSKMAETRTFRLDFDYMEMLRVRTELAQCDTQTLIAKLHANTARLIATMESAPDAEPGLEISMPWGIFTFAEVMAYPYWNMAYHLGQINAIAAQLENAG